MGHSKTMLKNGRQISDRTFDAVRGFVVGFIVCSVAVLISLKSQNQVIKVNQCRDFESCLLAKIVDQDLKGIAPEYVVSVAALESGRGNGKIYKATHNLFSIKRQSDGVCRPSTCYRDYSDDVESVKDYIRFITTKPRYFRAYQSALMDDPINFFTELQKAKYAEDKQYAKKIIKIFTAIKHKQALSRAAQRQVLVNRSNDWTIN